MKPLNLYPHKLKHLFNTLFQVSLEYIVTFNNQRRSLCSRSHQPDWVEASWIFIRPLCPSAAHNRYLTDKNTHEPPSPTNRLAGISSWQSASQTGIEKTDVHTCLLDFFCLQTHSLTPSHTHTSTRVRACFPVYPPHISCVCENRVLSYWWFASIYFPSWETRTQRERIFVCRKCVCVCWLEADKLLVN